MASVGDFLCARYSGILRDTPLTIHISRNRITSVECENKATGARVLGVHTHGMRTPTALVSLRSAPTLASTHVIGNILQDEKFPGIHIAFGDPLVGNHTGAPWKSTTHIDVVGLQLQHLARVG